MGRSIFIFIAVIVFASIISIGLYMDEASIENELAASRARVLGNSSATSPTSTNPPPPPAEPSSPRDLTAASTTGLDETPEADAIEENIQQAEDTAAILSEGIETPPTPEVIAPAPDTAPVAETVPQVTETVTEQANIVVDKMADGSEQIAGTVQGQIQDAVESAPVPAATPADPDALPVDTTPGATAVVDQAQESVAAVTETAVASATGVVAQASDSVNVVAETATTAIPTVDPATLPAKVIVLGYHQFKRGSTWGESQTKTPAGVFEQHMQMLRAKGFAIVPLEDVVHALNGQGTLPRRAAAITIDNGFKNALTYAGPVLKKFDYPWTFFVFTNLVGAGGTGASWAVLSEAFKKDFVSVQSQTRAHKFLTRGNGRTGQAYSDWVVSELVSSKLQIQREVGNVVNLLAFPYGNYDDVVQQKATAAGYTGMFTVEANPITTETKANAIGRFFITKFSADIFETYLDQPTLLMKNVTPAPGSVCPDARPTLAATIAYAGQLNPGSFKAEISGHPTPQVAYDSASGQVTITPADDLKDRTVRVKVTAKDAGTGQPVALTWYFYFEGALREGE